MNGVPHAVQASELHVGERRPSSGVHQQVLREQRTAYVGCRPIVHTMGSR